MKPSVYRILYILTTLVLAASLCFVLIKAHKSRSEAKRWRDTQRAGGVPRFWESQEHIKTTLMNPPNGQFAVTTDSGGKAVKLTESHGFAEDEDVTIAHTARHRLFCVGDSVTYGLLPNSQSFPHILEAMLDPTRKAWQVVNAGKAAESTYTALLRYKYVISKYDFNGIIVGWFAGNEPVEMMHEGVYTGPRVRRVVGGWSTLWEDDTPLQYITDADVDLFLPAIEKEFRAKGRSLREDGQDPMAFLKANSSNNGVLSRRYALYGGTSFVSAFHFLRYKPEHEKKRHKDLQVFVVRTLAVVRAFKDLLGDRLLYVVIPEAYEVDPGFVMSHPDFEGLLTALQLNKKDLSTAAYLRHWFMAILEHEGVSYVDPLTEMKALKDSSAVFRANDLHPTMRGNLAIARAIASQSNFSRPTAQSQKSKTSRTK
jgi:hypothetical protein